MIGVDRVQILGGHCLVDFGRLSYCVHLLLAVFVDELLGGRVDEIALHVVEVTGEVQVELSKNVVVEILLVLLKRSAPFAESLDLVLVELCLGKDSDGLGVGRVSLHSAEKVDGAVLGGVVKDALEDEFVQVQGLSLFASVLAVGGNFLCLDVGDTFLANFDFCVKQTLLVVKLTRGLNQRRELTGLLLEPSVTDLLAKSHHTGVVRRLVENFGQLGLLGLALFLLGLSFLFLGLNLLQFLFALFLAFNFAGLSDLGGLVVERGHGILENLVLSILFVKFGKNLFAVLLELGLEGEQIFDGHVLEVLAGAVEVVHCWDFSIGL